MEYALYERPREKLRNRGVQSLTNVELVQLIIGSGNKQRSAAHLAKEVVDVLISQHSLATYEQLIAIVGLGQAKVSQLLAVLELTRRLQLGRLTRQSETVQQLPNMADDIKKSRKRKIAVTNIAGDGLEINSYIKDASTLTEALHAIRLIFTNALQHNAHTLIVCIGYQRQILTPTDDETMAIVSKLFQTAELLHISVEKVWLMNSNGHQQVRKRWLS